MEEKLPVERRKGRGLSEIRKKVEMMEILLSLEAWHIPVVISCSAFVRLGGRSYFALFVSTLMGRV